MGLFNNIKMQDNFTACKKLSEPIYRTPTCLQESIPVSRISQNGVFEIEDLEGNKMYDKVYMFTDINFTDLDEDEKVGVFKSYCEILNTFDSSFKIQRMNLNSDVNKFKEEVLLRHKEGENESECEFANAYNEVIENRVDNGIKGITQARFLVVTCERENFENANAYFNSIESALKLKFKNLGSELIPLNYRERLKYLFYLYQMGQESRFDLSWGTLIDRHDWKNDVAGDYMGIKKGFLKFKDKFCTVMYLSSYGNCFSDNFISKLTQIPIKMNLTIDVTPIPKEFAIKKTEHIYSDVEKSIEEQQKLRNKNGLFSSQISYKKRHEKEDIERYLNELNKNDANMFWTNFLVVLYGDTMEELQSNIRTFNSMTQNFNFRKCSRNQLEAFNTSLPLGGRYVDYMRPLFTQPLAGILPFFTKQVFNSNGFYYGHNQNDKGLIYVDRKSLTNGNGFIFGIPGAGKSLTAKMEMGQVYSATNDDMIIVDPQGEYKKINDRWGGNYLDFSASASNYINPFDLPDDPNFDKQTFINEKSSFIATLVGTFLKDKMDAFYKAVIEKAVRKVCERAFITHVSPRFSDFYFELTQMEGDMSSYAKEISIAIDPFVDGSLSMFNHETNINMDSRVNIFGLRDIPESLWDSAMLIMINFINDKVYSNAKTKKTTWLWIDEFHVLTQNDETALEVEKIFKTFRKFSGLVTGMTQNITDMLQNKTTRTIVANCEFIILLKQANIDRDLIKDIIDISDSQQTYVTNSNSGTGLIRAGKDVIPFDNTIEKGGLLYELYNTDPHSKEEELMYA